MPLANPVADKIRVYHLAAGKLAVIPQGAKVPSLSGIPLRQELQRAAIEVWHKETATLEARAVQPAQVVPVQISRDLFMVYLTHPSAGTLAMTVIAIEA